MNNDALKIDILYGNPDRHFASRDSISHKRAKLESWSKYIKPFSFLQLGLKHQLKLIMIGHLNVAAQEIVGLLHKMKLLWKQVIYTNKQKI